MPEYAWLKEAMSGRGRIEMPVQKFVDWCQNRLKEIPEPERDSAVLLIEVVDYEMASIQIAVLYTPVDVATDDNERESDG